MDERRYYGLDALRGGMMMLGIVLHASELYLVAPPPQIPLPTDRNDAYVLDLLFHLIHSFRMPTFFVLAGFFTSLLVEKRGLIGTYRNRAARIVAPLLLAMVTILPLTGLFMIDFMLSARFGTLKLIPDAGQLDTLRQELSAVGMPVDRPSPAHLWFLLYLLYFYLLIPLCQHLVKRSLPFAQRVAKLLASPFTLALFSLCTAATLWPYRGGQVLTGFIYFRPHWPSLLYYGLFFVLGYLFHCHRAILETCKRYLPWYAGLALVLFPLSVYLSYAEYAAPAQGIHLAAVLAHGFCTWSLIYLCIGCALRFFDYASPWILYTSQSSYWVFLVHLPIVAFSGWVLTQYDFPGILKFLCVTGFTMLVCFVSYHYWVQNTRISVLLNGRRFDLKWPWLERRQRER